MPGRRLNHFEINRKKKKEERKKDISIQHTKNWIKYKIKKETQFVKLVSAHK
jgi:hypothetical protein